MPIKWEQTELPHRILLSVEKTLQKTLKSFQKSIDKRCWYGYNNQALCERHRFQEENIRCMPIRRVQTELTHPILVFESLKNFSKKLQKSFKKVLTNTKRCDRIAKLSARAKAKRNGTNGHWKLNNRKYKAQQCKVQRLVNSFKNK